MPLIIRSNQHAIAFALLFNLATQIHAAPEFVGSVKPAIEKHCAKCHNADKHKGNTDFSGFTDNLSVIKERRLWQKALDQIESGDMPPDDEEQMPADVKAKLIANIRDIAEHFDVNAPAFRDSGPSVLRRLTRAEYENTVRDLTGIDLDASREAGIATEDNGSAYANLATTLTLPPSLMEKYFIAADRVLERLFMTVDERKTFATKDYKTKQWAQSDEKAAKTLFAPIHLTNGDTHTAASTFVSGFMRRAYRRPVEQTEVQRVMKFYDAALTKGETTDAALRKAMKPVLVSPYFLYRIEKDLAGTDEKMRAKAPRSLAADTYRVSEHELATRLSYFLWSAPPDDELLTAADQGTLSKPDVLAAQVKRMLASPKAAALTDNFMAHWLQIEKLKDARPQQEAYPLFSNEMRQSMNKEMLMFITKLREEDRSVLDLLDSDYVYADYLLGKLYNLPDANGKELKRIALPAGSARGGLLGMSGVLAMTSHTNRTSPTLRGKYILEVLFGTPPPPPPANAGMLKAQKKDEPPKTFREQLAQHAAQANCAACHKRIDPLGFALENFDGIGTWRDSTADVKLDTGGVLPTGEKFNGVRELKKIILSKQDIFLRNIAAQTLTYALGRELDYYDEGPLRAILADMKKSDHHLSALVLGVVQSYPFLYRKNAESPKP